jgi:ubiquinone/menaquinone biosynthesis C-methylase UbiE
MPGERDIEKYYPPSYYGSRRSVFELLTVRDRIRKIKRMYKGRQPGLILDVGCGKGRMLHELRKKGWGVCGTELSDLSCDFAKEEFGLDIKKGDVSECALPDDHFDVITMWHSLEHCRDPHGTLNECHRVLKDGGILIVAVPNLASLQYRLSKDKWFHLDVPRHLYHFTPSVLTRLVNASGFKTVKVRQFSLEYDSFGLAQSILNRYLTSQNLLFKLLSGGFDTKKELSAGSMRTVLNLGATLFFAPVLFVPSVVLSFLSSLAGYGGTIEVYSRK